ncbi:unnamed protein product [Larinioides sclopetarius]|uniref:Uncharacterized protein n=1 Tax=Larinioides sclopetarius TaxID=280406 RepID=A0AAV2AED8_9ARAC
MNKHVNLLVFCKNMNAFRIKALPNIRTGSLEIKLLLLLLKT